MGQPPDDRRHAGMWGSFCWCSTLCGVGAGASDVLHWTTGESPKCQDCFWTAKFRIFYFSAWLIICQQRFTHLLLVSNSDVQDVRRNTWEAVYRDPTSFVMWTIKPSVWSASVQSVQSLSHVWLWNPMDCSMPGLPVHHQLLELTQIHVHQGGDAIQPSHPLPSPSPHTFNLSQHQGLFPVS